MIPAFETTSKRRKGFPSETRVKRGLRVVHGGKDLIEKLGRNDPCPCGSWLRFKDCCMHSGRFDGSNRNHFFQRLDVRLWHCLRLPKVL
jgi:SEC-C motif